jgi:hypothetical protein
MVYLVTVLAAMLIGFLAGLLSFRVKSRWCATCGAVKSCPRCAGWAGSVVSQGLSVGTTTGDRSGRQGRTDGRAVSAAHSAVAGF